MRARVVWADPVRDLVLLLPAKEQEEIYQTFHLKQRFPYMFPVRLKGSLRRHRWFLEGNWLVYYRVVDNTVYVRGLWPAHIP